VRDLRKFVGLTEAVKRTGASVPTLRVKADRQEIRSIRDPAGRRLLLATDVDAYAARRRAKLAAGAVRSQEKASVPTGR
jgi:hypothetical protein